MKNFHAYDKISVWVKLNRNAETLDNQFSHGWRHTRKYVLPSAEKKRSVMTKRV